MEKFSKKCSNFSLATMLIAVLCLFVFAKVAIASDNNNREDRDRDREDTEIGGIAQEPFSFANLQRLRAKYEQRTGSRMPSIVAVPDDQHHRNMDDNSHRRLPAASTIFEPGGSGIAFDEYEFDSDLDTDLPYGIQNVRRDLSGREVRSHKLRKLKTTFQSLCPSKRLVIPLETISYEYRPDHYEEVTCFHNYAAPTRDYTPETNKVCSEAGFTCIQLNRTVYLTRRPKGTDCWESETRIVPSGCECMWPKHNFGDIITFH